MIDWTDKFGSQQALKRPEIQEGDGDSEIPLETDLTASSIIKGLDEDQDAYDDSQNFVRNVHLFKTYSLPHSVVSSM